MMNKTVRYAIHESMIGYLTHAIVKYKIENQIPYFMVFSIHGMFKIDSVCILNSERFRRSHYQFQNENLYLSNNLFKPIF
jgi:hypothetical protein